MGALAWMFAEWLVNKRPTVLGLASGIVAGLVAITPAAGFVSMPASLLIGLGAGLLGFYSVAKLKQKLGYDDSLDAFGVHGMCGIWGALATGLFASPAINEAGAGLFFGNGEEFRTGQAAGPGTIEEQWTVGGKQKSPYGPGTASFHRIIQGAQGTMG